MIKDARGATFKVGQQVARAVRTQHKNGLGIEIARVTRIEFGKLYLDRSSRAMIHPERLVIVEVSAKFD